MFRRLKKKTKRAIANLVAAIHDKPLGPSSQEQERLVAELRTVFAKLDCGPTDRGGPAEHDWLENARRLRELVACDDRRRFLRWDVIQKTMFVTQADSVRPELQYLQGRSDGSALQRFYLQLTGMNVVALDSDRLQGVKS